MSQGKRGRWVGFGAVGLGWEVKEEGWEGKKREKEEVEREGLRKREEEECQGKLGGGVRKLKWKT